MRFYLILMVTKSYIGSLHKVVREIEPWGILLAIVGIFLAVYELNEARKERIYEQHLREATLFSMASEMLQKAREIDAEDAEDAERQFPFADIGQVPMMETIIQSGISLSGINATDVRLSDAKFIGADLVGAKFRGAVLRGTDLSGSNLTNSSLSEAIIEPNKRYGCIAFSNLSNANLSKSYLIRTRLVYVHLSNADFEGSIFHDARLLGVDLRNTNIEQRQLNNACGIDVKLPGGLSIESCDEDRGYSILKRVLEDTPVCN